ncbi:Hypothetical protein PP7435_CHR1-0443 [Komagataella phaffii CBS 7435]|nr:Hypothetical protein PP7435_CHR1-0443 [Komagataella phaffii CBS 7435]
MSKKSANTVWSSLKQTPKESKPSQSDFNGDPSGFGIPNNSQIPHSPSLNSTTTRRTRPRKTNDSKRFSMYIPQGNLNHLESLERIHDISEDSSSEMSYSFDIVSLKTPTEEQGQKNNQSDKIGHAHKSSLASAFEDYQLAVSAMESSSPTRSLDHLDLALEEKRDEEREINSQLQVTDTTHMDSDLDSSLYDIKHFQSCIWVGPASTENERLFDSNIKDTAIMDQSYYSENGIFNDTQEIFNEPNHTHHNRTAKKLQRTSLHFFN